MTAFSPSGESNSSRNVSLLSSIENLLLTTDATVGAGANYCIDETRLYEVKFYLSSIKSRDEILVALVESICQKVDELIKTSDCAASEKELEIVRRLVNSAKTYIETSVDSIDDLPADENETQITERPPETPEPTTNLAIAAETLRQSQTTRPSLACHKAKSAPQKRDAIQIDPQMLNEFVADCLENIAESEAALLTLESRPDNYKSIDAIFRVFHTIKGSSSYLGFNYIADLAHHAESLLSKFKDGSIKFNGYYSDLMLASVDIMKKMIVNIQNGNETPPPEYDEIFKLLIETPSSETLNNLTKTYNTDKNAAFALPETGPATALELGSPRRTRPVIQVESDHETAAEDASGSKPHAAQEAESTIRVKTDKIDRLIDTVGELVILNSMIFQDPVLKTSKNYELYKKITQAVKMVRELQDISMSMRMVPFKNTFQKMTRLVRDTSRKSGKNIEFITSGSESEVDRNLVDVIDGALVHLLRNAVDHGIESAEERERAGKPAKGTVKLSAYHEGGNVVIEVADDGAGLNAEKILNKALSKGIIKSSSGLSESEIYNLIFLPGFSTAESVTDISGRGVGMDVVKNSIEKLKGRIEIISVKGRGSKFILRMPLTLALTDGMLVRVGDHKFIIPVLSVQLTFQAQPSKVSRFEAKQEMVDYQGRTIPIFKLGDIFNIEGAVDDVCKGMIIVVNDGKSQSGLLVDEILGQQQIVAKSLEGEIKNVAGISGGTILSNGRVGLIIDVLEALKIARKK